MATLDAVLGRVQISLAAYPGQEFHAAASAALRSTPSEPLLGALGFSETQLCPQNRGILTVDYAQGLREMFPAVRFRLHANVRVQETRKIRDLVDWRRDVPYFQALAEVSRCLEAPAYTAHAGRRDQGNLDDVLDAARRAQDLFECPVGVEGHYPTEGDTFLVSSWQEYRELFESGVPYVVDLSHLHIVACQSGVYDLALLRDMLACDRCLEVHLSDNDGAKDQHRVLASAPWWWAALDAVHDQATVFSEGTQRG